MTGLSMAILPLAVVLAIIAFVASSQTVPNASATGLLGVDPTEEPSAFRDSIRFRQVDIIESGDPEIASFLLPDQEITAFAQPNLTYVNIVITGDDPEPARIAVNEVMDYLIIRNRQERQEGPLLAIDEINVLLAAQESELRSLEGLDDDVSVANRQGLIEAVANSRAELALRESFAQTTFTALEIVGDGESTSEPSQAWLAAIATFAGVLFAGFAVRSTVANRPTLS